MAGLGRDKYTQIYRAFLASRGATGGGVMLAGTFLSFKADVVNPSGKTAMKHTDEMGEMTGMDRLRIMYSYDAYGNFSPEISTVCQSGMMGVLIGTLIGGTLHSKEEYLQFIEKNQGTAFQNIREAQKDLQTKVTVGFGRGAWKWGWRLGLFCSSFMLVTSSIATYRGKSSFIEYSAGGFITGGMYKFNMGPRGFAAGAVIGGALGTVAGILNIALLYLTGTSTEQLRTYHYEIIQEKQQLRADALRKAREKDTDSLTIQHDSRGTSTLDPLTSVQDTNTNAKQ